MSREFVRLLLQSEPRIYAYIRSQVPQRADAEDILQETVTVLWTKFADFQPGTNFLAWAYEVARFKVWHYYRDRAREKRLYSEEFIALISARAQQMSAELGGLQEALAGCMTKLPPTDLDVVRRCYGTGATVRKVAGELNRPVDTIKSVLKRCRRALYECVRRTLAREGRS